MGLKKQQERDKQKVEQLFRAAEDYLFVLAHVLTYVVKNDAPPLPDHLVMVVRMRTTLIDVLIQAGEDENG